jgi:uncharacterized membrane-anchored protein YhcB (DUF1043 family)
VFSFSALFVTGLFSLLAGVALGAFGLYYARAHLMGRGIEQRLHQAESELKVYQREVAEHFAHTSQLVNNLTHAYREVNEHLANGALKLATPAISQQILDAAGGNAKASLREQPLEPPRDWAPSKGTLSDDYGLHDEDHTQSHQHFRPTESADDYDFDGKASRY